MGQQVAQHHVSWMMMMMMMMMMMTVMTMMTFDIPDKGIYLCTLHT